MILSLGDRRAGQAAESGADRCWTRSRWLSGQGDTAGAVDAPAVFLYVLRRAPHHPARRQCGTVIGSCGAWRTACCRRAFRKRRRLYAAWLEDGPMETDTLKQALGDDVAPLLQPHGKGGEAAARDSSPAVRCGTRWISFVKLAVPADAGTGDGGQDCPPPTRKWWPFWPQNGETALHDLLLFHRRRPAGPWQLLAHDGHQCACGSRRPTELRKSTYDCKGNTHYTE